MDDALTVFAYFNAQERAETYNMIAALTSSATMEDMVRTVTAIALIVTVFGLALRRDHDPTEFGRWIMMVTFLQSMLIVPKTTVVVVDRTGGQAPVVVANVPLVLAFIGSATSRIGDTLTHAYESVVALPDDIKFQRNGLMFGSAVLIDTVQATAPSPAFREDLARFVNQCTYYDLLAGRIRSDDLARSADIWTTMSATSNALRTPIEGADTGSMPCIDAYANLTQRWSQEIQFTLQSRGKVLNPGTLDNAAAAALLQSQITTAYAELAGIATDAAAALRQNMALNAVRDSQLIAAQRLDSGSAAIVGATQAQTEMTANLQYLSMARVAERATPRMRNVIEIVCDCVFPIIVCLILLAIDQIGKILRAYAMSLAWVQLIPPLYAILNFVMVRSGRPSLVGIATASGAAPGITLQNIAQMSQQGLSEMAIAGYMSLLLPLIAWGLVKAGEVGGSALFNAIALPAAGAAGSAAGSLSAGNISQGNVNMDTSSVNTVGAHHYDVAPSIASGYTRSTSAAGTAIAGADGTFRFQGHQSVLGFTANFGQKIGNALTQEAANRTETAQREAQIATEFRSAALIERMGLVKAYSDQHGTSNVDEMGKSSRSAHTLSQLEQIAENVNERLGLSSGSDIGRKLVGTLSAGAGVDANLWKLIRVRGGADVSHINEVGSKKALDAATAFARDELKSRGLTAEDALAEDFRHSSAFQWGAQHRSESTASSEAALTKSRQHSATSERARSAATSLSRQASVITDNWLHSSMNYEGYIASRLQQDNKLGLFNVLYQSNPEKAARLAAGYLAETNFDVMPILPPITSDVGALKEADPTMRPPQPDLRRPGDGGRIERAHDAHREVIMGEGFKDVYLIKSDVTDKVRDAVGGQKEKLDNAQLDFARSRTERVEAARQELSRKYFNQGNAKPPAPGKAGSVMDHQERNHRSLFGDPSKKPPKK